MHVVATAGHVDHGKSALLRRLTGMEPDRWAEERRRGLTIDLGYVWTDLPAPATDAADAGSGEEDGERGGTLTVAFVDVPGHDSFLPNMLCGVGVVDQVLFVVAADDGWSAQSEEHLEILDLLDRRGVAAVVTKADLAGPERTEEVVTQVRRRFAETSLHDTPVMAVDSLSGTGFETFVTTLTERLTSRYRPTTPSDEAAATRLWIDRAFTIKGAGTVVTGMLTSGELTVGQDVEVAPGGAAGRVRGLQCLERPVASAAAGTRVAVNLGGIDHDTLKRGDALVAALRGDGTDCVDVDLQALPHTGIGRTGAWHLHLGTATTTVRVWPLLDDLEPGARGPARLELATPLPLRAGDRFVLREAGRRRTAGGGRVLDPAPQGRRRGTDPRLTHALVLDELAVATDATDQLVALVDAHGGLRDRDQLRRILGRDDLDAITPPALTTVANRVVRRERLAPWTERILAAARNAPADHAVELARLTAAATDAGCPRELAAALVERAVQDGRLASHGGRFVYHDHDQPYRAARERRHRAFVELIGASALEPPDPGVAAAEAGIPSFEVQQLVDGGSLVACGSLLFTPAAIHTATTILREGPGRAGAPFTASEARQAWGTTRRCAMPLLEHLRVTGVTAFDGEQHRLLAA